MSDRSKLIKNRGAASLVVVAATLLPVVGAGAGAPVLSSAPVLSPAPAPVARVTSVRGQLFVRRRGAKVYTLLKTGKPVFGGDVVRTGARSSAVILLSNRAELELGASMAMEIPLPAEPAKVLPRERGPIKNANR